MTVTIQHCPQSGPGGRPPLDRPDGPVGDRDSTRSTRLTSPRATFVASAGQDAETSSHRGENERELADLGQRNSDVSAALNGYFITHTKSRATERLGDQDDGECTEHKTWRSHQGARIKEHADGHKKQHRKRVPHGQGFGCGAETVVRPPDHHARQKCPRAIETLKISEEPTAIPKAMTKTVNVKSSRDRVSAT